MLSKVASASIDILGVLSFILMLTLHFILPYLYMNICVPRSLSGFLISPFKIFSVECKIIRNVFNYTFISINNLKMIFISSITKKTLEFVKNHHYIDE
tara:strand:- start:299 stop:592 length:294 start_codon:yes stop_codon:yes gene_type:complete